MWHTILQDLSVVTLSNIRAHDQPADKLLICVKLETVSARPLSLMSDKHENQIQHRKEKPVTETRIQPAI